ncbi:MAG: hypothetical protein ACLFQP_05495 [Halothece sp.]
MTNATIEEQEWEKDQATWENLRCAIAASSGFKSWQLENGVICDSQKNLDEQVRTYLRETLETLAY